jgi:hypothetical protein
MSMRSMMSGRVLLTPHTFIGYSRSWTRSGWVRSPAPEPAGRALGRAVDGRAGAARHWKPPATPRSDALPSDSVGRFSYATWG